MSSSASGREKFTDATSAANSDNTYLGHENIDLPVNISYDALLAELDAQQKIVVALNEKQLHLTRQYNQLLQLTDISFLTIDRSGIITDCNRLAAKILDRPRSSVLQLPFVSLIKDEEQSAFKIWIEKAWTLSTDLYLAVKLKEFKGKHSTIEIKAFASIETGSAILYISLQDTEAQKRRSDSEEKYKTLIEQAYDGVLIYDLTGVIIEFNDKAHNYLGYTHDEFEKLSITDLFFNDDIIANPIVFNRLKEGLPVVDHRWLKRKDGSGIQMELNSKMMPDGSIIVFGRDITQRTKEAEEMQRLSKIIQNSRDEIFLVNPKTFLFEYANEAALKALQYTAGELYQIGPADIKVDVTADQLGQMLAPLLTGQRKEVNFEAIHQRKDKSQYPAEIFVELVDIGEREVFLCNTRNISEKKKAAVELAKKEKYFRTLIEHSSSAIILFDEGGNFIYQSPFVQKITGYKVREGNQSNLLSFIHPDDAPLFKAGLSDVLKTPGSTFTGQYRFRHSDGHYVWLEGSVTNLLEIDYIHALIANYQDISERKVAEENVKAERILLRTLIDNLPDTIYVKDVDGRKLIANREDQFFMALNTEAEALGKTDLELYPGPTGIEGHNRDLNVMAEEKPLLDVEFFCKNRNGREYWLLMSRIPLYNTAGSVIGLIGINRDITSRKQMEDELVKSNERYQYVTRATFDAIWDWDVKNHRLFLGENFGKYMICNPGEGETNLGLWNRNIHPDDFYRISVSLDKVINGPENIWVDEYRFKKLNGEYAHVQDRGVAIRDRTGKTIRMIGAMHDITEQKRDEEKVKRLNEELAVKAIALSSSNNELEKFAYVASHDLQEPLRMISSFLQLLKRKYEGQLDDTAGKYIHFAVDGANRMKVLINDLLEYSRVAAASEDTGNTDMNEVMKEVKEIFMISVEETGAVIECTDLPVLPGSRKVLMLQLMQNLVGNALKYQSTKTPVIKVAAVDKESCWLFSVADNGIGIDPAFCEKIFVIFQRLHNKDEFTGTGIGLSICKKIVEIHGGTIWVEQNVDGGSIFYFTIGKAG